MIVEEESDVAKFADFTLASVGATPATPVAAAAPTASAPTGAAAAPVAAAVAAPVVASGDRLKASPYAKKLAGEKNVPLNQLAGSGPGGRIVANDVNSFVPAAAPAPVAAATAPKAAAPKAAPAPAMTSGTDLLLFQIRIEF